MTASEPRFGQAVRAQALRCPCLQGRILAASVSHRANADSVRKAEVLKPNASAFSTKSVGHEVESGLGFIKDFGGCVAEKRGEEISLFVRNPTRRALS